MTRVKLRQKKGYETNELNKVDAKCKLSKYVGVNCDVSAVWRTTCMRKQKEKSEKQNNHLFKIFPIKNYL